MSKMKLMLGLAALMTALVVMTVPAYAEFEANTNTTSGKIKSFPATTVFHSTPAGPAIECKSATGSPEGEWAIQVKQKRANGTQEQTKKGPHEWLQIKKWGTCTGPTGIAAKVKCNLQVEQGGQNGSTGSVYPIPTQTGTTGCEVAVGTTESNECLVKVGVEGNKELSLVKLKNVGTNEIDIASEVIGIKSAAESIGGTSCTTLKIAGGAEGEFKTEGGQLVTEGQKLV